jgi:hypothetical protein
VLAGFGYFFAWVIVESNPANPTGLMSSRAIEVPVALR